jgi:hypothetical protein
MDSTISLVVLILLMLRTYAAGANAGGEATQ